MPQKKPFISEHDTFLSFLASVRPRRPLSHEKHMQLIARIKQASLAERKAPRLHNILVHNNMGLVINELRRWHNGIVQAGATSGDAFNLACEGLIRAAQKFEPERGLKFSTYAMTWIRSGIRVAIREAVGLGRMPHNAQQARRDINRFAGRYLAQHGHWPTAEEVRAATELTEQMVTTFFGKDCGDVSLSKLVRASNDDVRTMGDMLADVAANDVGDEDTDDEQLARTRKLRELCRTCLDDRQRLILKCRFELDMSLEETALELAKLHKKGRVVSRERVRQLQVKALRKLYLMMTGGRRIPKGQRFLHRSEKRNLPSAA